MNTDHGKAVVEPDSAAIFAIALSLWEICEKRRRENDWNISACYNGYDQFMRELIKVASLFEEWACGHVNFDEFSEVWPYYLGDNFGAACLSLLPIECLMDFDEGDCLRMALALKLPVILDEKMPIPIDLTAKNSIPGAGFPQFRIQTIRDSFEDQQPTPYVAGDEPFDENFGKLYFSLYGVDAAGLLEHIADRQYYKDILKLVQNLAPTIDFPVSPTFAGKLGQ